MNFQEFPWVVNLSLVCTELPLIERPAAAKAAGFDRVEYWWPFGMTGRPERGEIDAFVSAIEQSGVELVAMNLFARDMPVGERGVLSHPERIEEFRDRYWDDRLFESVESLRKIAAAAGISLLELALRWTQSRPVVNAVLLGASTEEQLQSNVDAFRKGPLERDALDEIDEIDEIDAVGAALRGPMPAYNR